MKETRIAPPEFWRFIFIIFICFLHFEEDFFNRNHLIANSGYLGVDFFLLLSGFVVGMNNYNKPIQSTIHFVWRKLRKLYPDFLFAVLLMFILWLLYDNKGGIKGVVEHVWHYKYQFIFANSLYPTNLEMRSIWFMSYWLVGVIVLSATLKRGYLKFVGALAISFMSWHIFNRGSLFNDPTTPCFLWSVRLMKCTSEVIIGALAYKIYWYLKKVNFSNYGIFILSIIEFVSVIFVMYIMSRRGRDLMDYEVCISFVLIIILSFLNITYLSQILNNKVSFFLGKISYPIYLYHLFVIKIVSIYWSDTNENSAYYYFLIGGGIIVFSILCHLFVEKIFTPILEYFCKKIILER